MTAIVADMMQDSRMRTKMPKRLDGIANLDIRRSFRKRVLTIAGAGRMPGDFTKKHARIVCDPVAGGWKRREPV
ncbi:MAG: hypothetical protein BGP06_03790 [Rhizobiales bacterium 65-9]|nr:MAG: hypothetical protein BGP06_03790 [Rhizobiales bacterium 65-9]